MASLTKNPSSKFWIACLKIDGRRTQRSTKTEDRAQAQELADAWEGLKSSPNPSKCNKSAEPELSSNVESAGPPKSTNPEAWTRLAIEWIDLNWELINRRLLNPDEVMKALEVTTNPELIEFRAWLHQWYQQERPSLCAYPFMDLDQWKRRLLFELQKL
jgi:hypothetical protein